MAIACNGAPGPSAPMPHPFPELDACDREILAAFRDHEAPPPGTAERVYERVVAHPDGTLELQPAPGVPWARSIAISVAIAAGVLLAIRGVVTGAAALRESPVAVPTQAELGHAGEPNEGRAQVAKPAKPTPRPARPAPAPAIVDTPAAAVDPSPVDAPPPARSRVARATTPAEDGSNLARDLELLATAKRTADATARIALLERHAREHPKSKLAEERDVLTIETLCALGRQSDAKKRARTFAERHAGSAFNTRVEKSCAGAGA